MNSKITHIVFDEPVRFDMRFYDNSQSAPILFLFHGFKGFKDWGFLPYLSLEMAKAGNIVITPDFSKNGILQSNPVKFDEDIFARQTISGHLYDAKLLITQVIDNKKNYGINDKWNGEIILAGHSLGGAIAIMASRYFSGVKKLILIAAIADMNRNTERQLKAWKKKGYTEVKISSSGQLLKLNYSYVEDKNQFSENRIKDDLSLFDGEILILHASEDLIVKDDEAKKLKHYSQNGELVVIDKANHTFSANHPMSQPSNAINRVINEIKKFLTK